MLRRSVRWWVVAGSAVVGLFALVMGVLQLRARQALAQPDIILISIDTLRPDHLGCYGYDRPTSPNIDRFRRDAVLFRTTIAAAPSTLPSHASLFTSLAPQHHGASHTGRIPLAPSLVTIAEVLRDSGYETAAIVGGGQLAPEWGLTQGFETYEMAWDETFEQIAGRAADRIARRTRRPLFLFLHTYQIHHPYMPDVLDLERVHRAAGSELPFAIEPARLAEMNEGLIPYSAQDRDHVVALYDGEIAGMDRGMGDLVAELKRLGMYDRALILFTSDHGEEFGEHGFLGWHSHTLFEELLRVPLLMKLPDGRRAGTEIGGVMRSLDIAPMILEAAGLPAHPQFRQFTLAGALARGQTRAVPALLWMEPSPGTTHSRDGIRTDRWKLSEDRLYDLVGDPQETRDVAREVPEVARRLAAERTSMRNARRAPGKGPAITPSQETIDSLRALGYVQ